MSDPMIGERMVIGHRTDNYFFCYENIPDSLFEGKHYKKEYQEYGIKPDCDRGGLKKLLDNIMSYVFEDLDYQEYVCNACYSTGHVLKYYKKF